MQLQLDDIATEMCIILDVPKHLVLSETRVDKIVIVRHILCYVAYYYTNNSYKSVGKFLNRDHSTTQYMVNKIRDYIATNDGKFDDLWLEYTLKSKIFCTLTLQHKRVCKRVKTKKICQQKGV